MASPYFILAVRQTAESPWESVFGSAARADVVAEIKDYMSSAYITHIQEAASDSDEDIAAALAALGT
jgi:hypothetical protein